jgi:hypothetical protein
MGSRFRLDGLAELKDALTRLPADLTTEASDIVWANAAVAAQEIRDAYPSRTNNLRNHVTVSRAGGAFSTSAKVKNTAKHAWLFENGSQARHTDLGANRGSMPAGHVFIPVMMRRRRIMYEVLKRLLVSHGLLVSGDA